MDIIDLTKWATDSGATWHMRHFEGNMTAIHLNRMVRQDSLVWYTKIVFERDGTSVVPSSVRYLYDLKCRYRHILGNPIKAMDRVFEGMEWGKDILVMSEMVTSGSESINDYLTSNLVAEKVSVSSPEPKKCDRLKFGIVVRLADGREVSVRLSKSSSDVWMQRYMMGRYTDTMSSPDLDRIDKDIAQWINKNA